MDVLLQKAMEELDAFMIVDKEKKIVHTNQAFASLLGLTINELAAKNIGEFILDDTLDQIMAGSKEGMATPLSLLSHKKKIPYPVLCNCKPIKSGNNIIGVLFLPTKRPLESMREVANLQSSGILDLIIGDSKSIREMRYLIQRLAKSRLTILITGETGVGKDIFARVIHRMSNPNLDNFIKFNCASIKDEWPAFKIPRNSTLFFDEVSELPLHFQSKLLQVIQKEERNQNEGGLRNIRIICSSSPKMDRLIEEEKFRSDLYFRINTIELAIPPLRERKEDIDKYCQYYIDKMNREHNFSLKGIEPEVKKLFYSYDWPGNVRELKHAIQQLAILNPEGYLRMKDCGFILQRVYKGTEPPVHFITETLSAQRMEIEKKAIINALQEARYNKSKAARLLSIDRSALYKKMKRYQINDEKSQIKEVE